MLQQDAGDIEPVRGEVVGDILDRGLFQLEQVLALVREVQLLGIQVQPLHMDVAAAM